MREYTDIIETSGTGLWSSKVKTVKTNAFCIPYVNQEFNHGELRVFFDVDTWNIDEDGLIYTDPAFLDFIREAFGTDDIDYSEQGMQGTGFVSFDVGEEFLMMYGERFE